MEFFGLTKLSFEFVFDDLGDDAFVAVGWLKHVTGVRLVLGHNATERRHAFSEDCKRRLKIDIPILFRIDRVADSDLILVLLLFVPVLPFVRFAFKRRSPEDVAEAETLVHVVENLSKDGTIPLASQHGQGRCGDVLRQIVDHLVPRREGDDRSIAAVAS
jgi:hypothetical protein